MMIVGYVKEYSPKELVIGLPNGLNGYVNLSSFNEILQKLSRNADEDDDETDDDDESGVSHPYLLKKA